MQTTKHRPLRNGKTLTQPLEEPLTMKQAAPFIGIGYYALSRWINDPVKRNRPECIRRGKRFVRFTREQIRKAQEKFTQNGGAK